MNLFLDNNVLIGYIFETDNWNLKSLDVMRCSLDRYSSNTVCQECRDIYKKNLGTIKKEFKHIIREFNRKQSFSLKKASSVLKRYQIGDCLIEYFKNNPVENIKEAKNHLRNLQRDMEKRCLDNYQNINKLVKYVPVIIPITTFIGYWKQMVWQKKNLWTLKLLSTHIMLA
ncbi:MAG: hypothetical protein A9957_02815 [Methanohalophilus sp. DAL1]|jgi:hypothetical protein|nr:MAG: hypothetical protein A9957_02815 [Methanohalophilus sp. DAL1]RXG35189.1 hypothetical protein CI957_213 [Methanohalophilus sp. WG1-DM]